MLLKQYAEVASSIFNNGTTYSANKKTISYFFDFTKHNGDKEISRLTLIDSLFSTNMNKRRFGIEEIAFYIRNYSTDDSKFKEEAFSFIDNPNKKSIIYTMLLSKFGYNNLGDKFGSASSLITKYFYFLTKYNFPIYDSLVKKAYRSLQKRMPQLKLTSLNNKCDINFFILIKRLNEISGISDFEKLDNLLWVYGKVLDKSFATLFSLSTFLEVIKLENEHKQYTVSDKLFLIKSNNMIIEKIFTPEQIDFLRFCDNTTNI